MKTQELMLQERMSNFSNFLNNTYTYKKSNVMRKFKSSKSYQKLMLKVINDLAFSNPNDFFRAQTAGMLLSFYKRLKESANYKRRSPKDQNDMSSAFKLYIFYKSTQNKTNILN